MLKRLEQMRLHMTYAGPSPVFRCSLSNVFLRLPLLNFAEPNLRLQVSEPFHAQANNILAPVVVGRILAAALDALPVNAQTNVTLFEGAQLITGDGGAPIEDGAFVIDGNRIVVVGRRGEVTAPAGSARIDLAGKTVNPRYRGRARPSRFPRHGVRHMSKDYFARRQRLRRPSPQRYAYHGVVAVLSTGTDFGDLAFKLRDEPIPNAARILTVGRGLAYPGSGPADKSRNDVPFPVASARAGARVRARACAAQA